MTEARDARLLNRLGVLALSLADSIRDVTAELANNTGAAPAALVGLREFLDGCTTEELAQATGLTHSGAVRLVDRLVDDGYVARRSGKDARSVAIVLTGQGRSLSKRLSIARAHALETAIDSLSDPERDTLLALIDSMVGAVALQRLNARRNGEAPSGWMCRLCDAIACGRNRGHCPAANAVGGNQLVDGGD